MINSILRLGWYPWLVALYPVIYLYSVNLAKVREDDVIEVILFTLLITTIVYLLSLMVTRRKAHKSALITSIITLTFLIYGHIYDALQDIEFVQTLLMPIVTIALILAIFVIIRSKRTFEQVTPTLNILFGVLTLFVVWTVLQFKISPESMVVTAQVNPYERNIVTAPVQNSTERPDVYFIIMDGYSSNDYLLQRWGYDNSDFTDALEARGFYVAYNSKSNYGGTLASLSSTLNMRYLSEEDQMNAREAGVSDETYLRSLIANSEVAYKFKEMGYSYIYTMSGHLSPSILADANIVFYPDGQKYVHGSEFDAQQLDVSWAYKQPFWPLFIETTILQSMSASFVTDDTDEPLPLFSPDRITASFEEVKKIPEIEAATFTFAHILKPHCPVVFDREGNVIEGSTLCVMDLNLEAFFNQLHYINGEIIDMIDTILEKSTVPPIIILQADHGSDLGIVSMVQADGSVNATFFEIMNAMYLPDNGADALYPSISSVNTFRVIFNEFFGDNYELLESKHYNIPNITLNPADWFTTVLIEEEE